MATKTLLSSKPEPSFPSTLSALSQVTALSNLLKPVTWPCFVWRGDWGSGYQGLSNCKASEFLSQVRSKGYMVYLALRMSFLTHSDLFSSGRVPFPHPWQQRS